MFTILFIGGTTLFEGDNLIVTGGTTLFEEGNLLCTGDVFSIDEDKFAGGFRDTSLPSPL